MNKIASVSALWELGVIPGLFFFAPPLFVLVLLGNDPVKKAR